MRYWGGTVYFLVLTSLGMLFPLASFASGNLLVYAQDTGSGNNTPPPAATIVLDGGTHTQSFGTNNWVIVSDLPEGTHTVRVTTDAGYLPRESSTVANAVNDPDSAFGNPRHVEIFDDQTTSATFRFDPVIAVTAVVRDAWTMERLEDAVIEFTVNSGPNMNSVYYNYPWAAGHAANWSSTAASGFPSNTFLHAEENYDLGMTKPDYQSFTTNSVVSSASAGDVINLGTLYLLPVDANTNQIADAWETLHFGAGSTVVAGTDSDGDGMSNRAEYIAGTDPVNPSSFLGLGKPVFRDGELALTWNTADWRTYRVTGTTGMCETQNWVQVAGPWEATNGQAQITWVETNLDLSWHSNYRVEVIPCDWQRTNQMLTSTNRWTGGGRGSGGPPPIP